MNWKPIETAPKDGRFILAYFDASFFYASKFDVVCWNGWGGGVWRDSSGFNCVSTEPSHWMPLPEPPIQSTR
jgi:hypothetical protein